MIDLARSFFASPLPLFLVLVAVSTIFQAPLRRRYGNLNLAKLSSVLRWAFVLLLIGYGAVALAYLFSPAYLDQVSPSIAAASWLFARGEPLYHSLSDSSAYSLLYGPLTFIANGFTMELLGPSLASSKAAGLMALLLAFICLYAVLKEKIAARDLPAWLGLAAAVFLIFWTFSFIVRPDVMIMALVAAALLVVVRLQSTWSPVLIGLALGGSANLKITAVLYFLPLMFLLYKKSGLRPLLVSILWAAVASMAPFVLFANIDLGNYLDWLRNAGRHGLLIQTLASNLAFAALLWLPFWPLVYKKHRTELSSQLPPGYFIWLAIAMVTTSLVAAKPGSGQTHFVPFVPLAVYGYALFYSGNVFSLSKPDVRLFVPPLAATLLLFGFFNITRIARLYYVYPNEAATDLAAIIKTHPETSLQMGYSQSPRLDVRLSTNLPYLRPILAFAGHEYIMDQSAVADLEASGAALPSGLQQRFEDCQGQGWLFPRGGKPFENVTGYGRRLFDDAFQQRFMRNFQLQESTAYFDLWACRR